MLNRDRKEINWRIDIQYHTLHVISFITVMTAAQFRVTRSFLEQRNRICRMRIGEMLDIRKEGIIYGEEGKNL